MVYTADGRKRRGGDRQDKQQIHQTESRSQAHSGSVGGRLREAGVGLIVAEDGAHRPAVRKFSNRPTRQYKSWRLLGCVQTRNKESVDGHKYNSYQRQRILTVYDDWSAVHRLKPDTENLFLNYLWHLSCEQTKAATSMWENELLLKIASSNGITKSIECT